MCTCVYLIKKKINLNKCELERELCRGRFKEREREKKKHASRIFYRFFFHPTKRSYKKTYREKVNFFFCFSNFANDYDDGLS